MASPEQNALLALQLLGAPAEQFNQQNNAKTNLLLKLTTMNREEALKRELTDKEATLRRDLAVMMNEREDTRQQGADSREDKRIKESERRQREALDAREKERITAEMNRLYPQYAQAAARAGVTIKQRKDFTEDNEGLGQLAAELRTAEVEFETKGKRLAADASIAELDDITNALGAGRKRLMELANPSDSDLKIARSRAVERVKQAILAGDIASTSKLSKKAVTDGLAALSKGDEAIAAKLLGEESLTAYRAAYDENLMALPNTKARLQERAQAQQQLLQLQGQAGRVESDLRKAAAANPFLAEGLTKRRSGLQELMAEPEKTKGLQRPFGDVTPEREETDAEPTAVTAPQASTTVSPNIFRMMGYQPGGTNPAAAPVINAPVTTTAPTVAPAPYFRTTSGDELSDLVIRRPLDRVANSFSNIYGTPTQALPASAKTSLGEQLMQILHGGDFATPESRAVGRRQIYQLLGVPVPAQ